MKDERDFITKGFRYSWISVVLGVITSLSLTPFLAPLFFKFGTLFGREYLGYENAYDADWYSLVASITSVFMALIITKEIPSEEQGNGYSNSINWSYLGKVAIRILKYLAVFIITIFLFSQFVPAYEFVCSYICI